MPSVEACLHDKNIPHWIFIDSNISYPHGMHIEEIHIKCELGLSNFEGGLNVNCKWIG